MDFTITVCSQQYTTVIMTCAAGNVAVSKRAALRYVCNIFKRYIITFHRNRVGIQLAKVHHIAFEFTHCQRISAFFKRTKLIGT